MSFDAESTEDQSKWGGAAVVSAVAALGGALAVAACAIARAHVGLDLTDEAYYLQSIAKANESFPSTTQFGAVFHPLWMLAAEDIERFRQLNIAITSLLGALAAASLITANQVNFRSWAWRERTVAFCICGTVGVSGLALGIAQIWTPSYNWLAIQGCLTGCAGLGLTLRSRPSLRMVGAALLGIGVVLAFLAKPTTGAAAAACLGLAVAVALRRESWRVLVGATVSGGLVLLALMLGLDGTIPAFIQRYQDALDALAILDTGHTASPVQFALNLGNDFPRSPLALALDLVVAAGTAVLGIGLASQRFKWFAASILLVLIVASATVVVLEIDVRLFGAFFPVMLYMPVIGVLAVLAWRVTRAGESGALRALRNWRNPAVSALIASLSFATAFGTRIDPWTLAAAASVFVTLAMIYLSTTPSIEKAWPAPIIAVVAVQTVLLAVMLADASHHPYRQPPRTAENQYVSAEIAGGNLLMDRSQSDYLGALRAVLKVGGFPENGYLLDLTGHSPGAVFAADANSVGASWNIGGYPGSDPMTAVAIRAEPCSKIGSAWILTEPGGPRALDSGVLERTTGLSLDRDYEKVGVLTRIPDANGQIVSGTQVLHKPRGNDAEVAANCDAFRGEITP